MSSIFVKTISGAAGISNTNCLVMSPRESIRYPLPTDNWGGIRVGMFVSNTNAEGLNSDDSALITITTGAQPMNYKEQGFYFGFSAGDVFSQSFSFIGHGYPTGVGATVVFQEDSEYQGILGPATALIMSGDSQSYFAFDNNFDTAGYGANGNEGMTGFYTYHDIRLDLNQESGQYILQKRYLTSSRLTEAGLYMNADIGTGALFRMITGTEGIYDDFISTTISGYFTTNGGTSGVALPRPDSFFIYWPLYPQRLRIHNLGIVKTR